MFQGILLGTLVLLMDASYLALKGGDIKQKIDAGLLVYVLKDDIEKRGIQNLLISDVKAIDYEEFIDLIMNPNVKTLNM